MRALVLMEAKVLMEKPDRADCMQQVCCVQPIAAGSAALPTATPSQLTQHQGQSALCCLVHCGKTKGPRVQSAEDSTTLTDSSSCSCSSTA